MPIDLIAGTDAGLCAVFDPASVARLRVFRWTSLLAGGLDKEADAGRLVLLDTGGEGTFKFRAYVDEPAPPELLASAFHAERGKLLRVPSGTLRSVGAEYLAGELDRTPPEFVTDAKVPAGDYSVDAFLIDASRDEQRPLLVDRVTGAGFFVSLALGSLALLLRLANDSALLAVSLSIVGFLVVFWASVIGWHLLPSTRAAKLRRSAEATPSLVLVLTRLAAERDRASMKGVRLRPPTDSE